MRAAATWRRLAATARYRLFVAAALIFAGLCAYAAPASAQPRGAEALAPLRFVADIVPAPVDRLMASLVEESEQRMAEANRHTATVLAAAIGGAIVVGAVAGGPEMALVAGFAMFAAYLVLP